MRGREGGMGWGWDGGGINLDRERSEEWDVHAGSKVSMSMDR